MQNWEGVSVRCAKQDLPCRWFNTYWSTKLRNLLWHDWSLHRYVIHLWVGHYISIHRLDETQGSAFDDESSSIIELLTASKQESSNTYLMLRQVGKYEEIRILYRFIALVCIVNEKDLAKKNLINYNIDCFKKGLTEIFQTSEVKK